MLETREKSFLSCCRSTGKHTNLGFVMLVLRQHGDILPSNLFYTSAKVSSMCCGTKPCLLEITASKRTFCPTKSLAVHKSLSSASCLD